MRAESGITPRIRVALIPVSTLEGLRDETLGYLRAGISVGLLGLPGSGRTTVLHAVTEELVATGRTVIELQGLAGLADRPLEALAVAGLLAPAASRQHSAVASAVEELRRVASTGRVVVVVDDAEDLDPTSVGVISAAIGGRGIPLLSSVTTVRRPRELTLSSLVRPGVRLTVPPMAFEDTPELMRSICGGPIHTSTLAIVHARAGGLPGLVHAITDNAKRHGLLVQRNGLIHAAAELWTPHLAQTLLPFVQGLTPTAMDGLIKLACVGAVDIEVARRLVPAADLEELDDRGILTFAADATSTMVSVYPPLLGDHLSRERLGARRLRLQGEINEALQGEGGGPIPALPVISDDLRRFRRHLPGADDPDPETRVVTDAVLNRLVHDRRNAQILARRAEWEQRRDAPSSIALAKALMVRGVEAAELDAPFATPLPADDLQGRALLAVWQATYLAYGQGDLPAAIALLERTTAEVGSWAPLLAAAADELTLFLDRVPPPRSEVSEEPRVADAQRVVAAERLLAAGRPGDAIDELNRMAGADADTDERAEVIRGVALVLAGDLDDALAWSRVRYERGRSRFDPSLILGHGYVVALAHLYLGDDRALRAHLSPLLSMGVTPLRHSAYLLGALVVATRVAWLAERAPMARALADQAGGMGLAHGPFPMMTVAQGEDHAALAEGADPRAVAERLWTLAEDLRGRGYVVGAVIVAVRAVILRPEKSYADGLAGLAEGADSTLLTLLIRTAEAYAADPETQLRVGGELVDAGLAGFGIGLQVTAVQALEDSDPDRAASEARRLQALADRLGGSYHDLVEPVALQDVLTSREREVAELAAGGLTNVEIAQRLVVSVRTVENHLYRAFRKLGVKGRDELTAGLQQHG